jgi:hypothetical protein
MRKLFAVVFCLLAVGCAQNRAEERAIDHALGLGFVSPAADCDGELASLPEGFLLCGVEEREEGLAPRGIFVACPSGLADGPCTSPPPAQGFKVNAGDRL